jgi:hypothetical protein
MYKKFLRTSLIIIGLVLQVSASTPGFYSEYGDPSLVATVRGLAQPEREARLGHFYDRVGDALNQYYVLICEGCNQASDAKWVFNPSGSAGDKRNAQWLAGQMLDRPFTADKVNHHLFAIVKGNYFWPKGPESVIKGTTVNYWVTAKFEGLDVLMREALDVPMGSIKKTGLSF